MYLLLNSSRIRCLNFVPWFLNAASTKAKVFRRVQTAFLVSREFNVHTRYFNVFLYKSTRPTSVSRISSKVKVRCRDRGFDSYSFLSSGFSRMTFSNEHTRDAHKLSMSYSQVVRCLYNSKISQPVAQTLEIRILTERSDSQRVRAPKWHGFHIVQDYRDSLETGVSSFSVPLRYSEFENLGVLTNSFQSTRAGNWLRTITSDRTVCNKSSLSFWARRVDRNN